jgi:hypothetical protein
MSEQLVLEAYSERQKRELDDFMNSAPATTGGAESAPAPAQPTSNIQPQNPEQAKPGVVSEMLQPWQQAGQQMANAAYPAAPPTVGVPRRLWEFVKGAGNALVAPAQSLGELVGHHVASLDEVTGAMTDQALDQRIEQAKQNAPGELPFYERLRSLPYEERIKLTHEAVSFGVSNVAAGLGLTVPIPGVGAVAQGLNKAARWVRSGAGVAEEAASAAGAGERMASNLAKSGGTNALTEGLKLETAPSDLVAQAEREPGTAPEGYVRFYHGGVPGEGPRWVSADLAYAEGYARKSPGGIVQYVDIPESSPLLEKAFDDAGTSTKAPYVNFEAPADVMSRARPIGDAVEARINELQGIDTNKVINAAEESGRPDFEPSTNGSPNTARMNVSDSAKAMIQNINGQLEEAGNLTRATVRSNEATVQASGASPYRRIETILEHPDEQPLAAHDLTAARDTRDALLVHADTLAERFLAGDEAVGPELRAAILTTGQVSAKVTNATTAGARAVQSGNIISEASRSRGLDLSRWAKGIEGLSAELPATDAELAAAFRASKDAETAAQTAEWTAKRPSGFWNYYYGLNLLSSPATHISKLTGEVTAQVVGLADRTAGALVAKPFHWIGMLKGPGLSLSEGPAYVSGALDHIGDAFRAVANAYKGGRVVVKDGQLVTDFGAQGEGWLSEMDRLYGGPKVGPSEAVDPNEAGGALSKFYDVASTKTVGGLLPKLGEVVKNTMGGVADFWRVLTFHGEIAAQAERLGKTAEDVAALTAHPTESMLIQAESAMKERTFSKEFSSEIGQAAQALASTPVMRLTVTPFWRTPVRLAEFGMDHTPVLNEIASLIRGDFQAGGVRAEMALGRSATSWAFTTGMYQLAAHGVLTGAGPSDPKLRAHMQATGWQPFSVHVGDRYISFKPILATLPAIGVAATLAEMAPHLKDNDLYTTLQAAALANAQGALDHPFWQGAAEAFEAIDGARQGKTELLEKWVNNRATSIIVPGAALGRTIVRGMTGNEVLDTKPSGDATGVWNEVQALLKQAQSNIPGWASHLPAERNPITGEPITKGANAWGLSPYYVTTANHDTVLQEIARLQGAGLPKEAPRVLGGVQPSYGPVETLSGDLDEGVRLTEAERAKLVDHLTGDRLDGKTLHDRLEQVISSNSYQALSEGHKDIAGPDGAKALEIKRIYAAYLRSAEMATRKDFPALGDAIVARQIARKQALIPEARQQ